ncbi:Protein phosphatase 2C (PP2C)-like domain containing protein [Amanita muscaria]
MSTHFDDSPDARSKSLTTADLDTFGVLNRQSRNHPIFRIGISEDKGTRRTMEDAHSFVVDFDSVRGQGFFAVFDGHAGKHAAEWCGRHFHECLLSSMHASPDSAIPDVLNEAFHKVDESLSHICKESDGKIHSGCTAVTAFLRIEDSDGRQSFRRDSKLLPSSPRLRAEKLKGSQGANHVSSITYNADNSATVESDIIVPPTHSRRVLYTANAGDARGVLCRNGQAVRLTYDHKGTDKQEARRIMDAGGFIMSGRVNGVLAVTRSLGDPSMKEFVVGAPYTTETELCEDDEFLVLACDGLWDVISDQGAVELVQDVQDAQEASEMLLSYALLHHTTDNVTVLVVRFKHFG